MERKLEWLQNKMADIGDSITKVEELFQEFEEFEQQAQVRSTPHYTLLVRVAALLAEGKLIYTSFEEEEGMLF